MLSQCSFFTNFVAAFRAHAAIQQAKAPSSNPSKQTSSVSHHPHHPPSTQPRSIATNSKAGAASTATALGPIRSPRANSSSPLSCSPATQTTSAKRMPRDSNARRGSDSSTEGFREVHGAEKWYIGGRTATGEEKFFKLGVIKRQRSRDRLSLDRLSL